MTAKSPKTGSKYFPPEVDPKFSVVNVMVGLEIHQQLASQSKLFCECSNKGAEQSTLTFMRKLRPAYSELGGYDPAALFEATKMKSMRYHGHPSTSCLVEADEEPPHSIDKESLETALILALALHSKVVDEIHVMRKIVIDGSNTTGFQRTMLISTGGYLEIDGNKKVGVQSICLEEDAARLLSDDNITRDYSLDRLGTPLIEVALEPLSGPPQEVLQAAVTLGRLLRASKRVERGIGTIRQDINVSVNGGAVVEIKGIQQLDQLIKVIDFETKRQLGLIQIAAELTKRLNPYASEHNKYDIQEFMVKDTTDILRRSSSKAVVQILESKSTQFMAIKAEGFDGILGYEPYMGVRLGRQLAEIVRFYGLGGIFHSDELPNYGIVESEVTAIKERLGMASERDAFILIGGESDRVQFAVDAILQRLEKATQGVIPETRAATLDGKTIFLRPRPGSSRMYPETDILPVKIDDIILNSLKGSVPKSFESYIKDIMQKYQLNRKLATEIFDSDRLKLFEDIVANTKVQPTFIASKITEDLISLRRKGLNPDRLSDKSIKIAFQLLDGGDVAKESIPVILETMLTKDLDDVKEAIQILGFKQVSESELNEIIDKIIADNMVLIRQKGRDALGTLMGRSMSILRGRIDGKMVSSILQSKLEQSLS
ncbi:MAG TPA: Glu-tRNA(Gln) amidotransferase subunit GatE [Nitrososphaeraceae archaeon]|nr:Glu-tRNA(Gln) amidotransferase subunit GatE [Nitrososphaeraceae archaeon]